MNLSLNEIRTDPFMDEWADGVFSDQNIATIGLNPKYPTASTVMDEYIAFLKSIESDSKIGRGFSNKFGISITE